MSAKQLGRGELGCCGIVKVSFALAFKLKFLISEQKARGHAR